MGRVVEAFDTQLGRTVALKEVLPTRRRRSIAAVRARGPDHRAARAPVDRAALRRGHDAGRPAVLRDAQASPGRPLDELIARAPRSRRAARAAAERARGDRRDRARAQARRHPSRSQAGEHPRRRARRDRRDRLGPREGHRRGGRRTPGDADDADRRPIRCRRRSGSVFGTPGFMAPEQARGEELGPQRRCVRARRDALSAARRPRRRSRARARPR